MHTNHRRKNKQDYPWDLRSYRPPRTWKYFRAAERTCLDRLRNGEDPDDEIWPHKRDHILIYDRWM